MSQSTIMEVKKIKCASGVDEKVSLMSKIKYGSSTLWINVKGKAKVDKNFVATKKKDVCNDCWEGEVIPY